MRLATCEYRGKIRLARVQDGGLDLLPETVGASFRQLLAGDGLGSLQSVKGTRIAAQEVKYLPPIPDADKILCVGFNYRGHAAETGTPLPKYPSLFVRFASSQVGHEQPVLAPSISAEFDYEGELAVIIGKAAWRVSAAQAMQYVAGYSCFGENSVRDFQSHARQATAGKNFLASGAFGPWLVTQDEIPDPAALELSTRLNGEVVQHAPLTDLVFSIPQLIEYITQFTRLLPGDVISTGTPDGVGFLRKPPVYLKPGDRLEVDIPGVGLLRNHVIAEADGVGPSGELKS
jgi:2-keto-4-pentenoate hydratase/2-oxohepta-3-ene-1,7-dioic acid hydratase in catechol pathway